MNRITYEEIEKLADDNEVVVKHCQDDICEVNWKTAGIGFTSQFDSWNKGIYGIHSDPDDAKALLDILAQCKEEPEITYDEQQETAIQMQQHGGYFVNCIGHALGYADKYNAERIRKAFPEIWEKYSNWCKAHEAPKQEAEQ